MLRFLKSCFAFALIALGSNINSVEAGQSNQDFVILDDYLAQRINLLEQRSPSLRAAMDIARAGRIPVVIGTPAQVRNHVAQQLTLGGQIGGGRLGELLVRKVSPDSPDIDLIVIRVQLDQLRAGARWRGVLGSGAARRRLADIVDTILIHELWGHLIPILEAGNYTGSCADPTPGQSDVDSCVMQRENGLRQELGLKPRKRYSMRVL